jgi:hypothetical protein
MDLDPKYDDYDFPTTAPENQSGHPGHTTKEQDAQVHQLRAMLEKEGYTQRLDTLTLLRFLRARKFNVEHSKAMCVSPSHVVSFEANCGSQVHQERTMAQGVRDRRSGAHVRLQGTTPDVRVLSSVLSQDRQGTRIRLKHTDMFELGADELYAGWPSRLH